MLLTVQLVQPSTNALKSLLSADVVNKKNSTCTSRVETPPINSKFLQKLKVGSHCSFSNEKSGTHSIKRNEQR